MPWPLHDTKFAIVAASDDNRKFVELYNVRRLTSSFVAGDSQVCISTIQRITLPPEFFDFIIIAECHRSIYDLWRQAARRPASVLLDRIRAERSRRTSSSTRRKMIRDTE